jgi:alpha-tubulin suppressor-like RCC1 family protein
MPFAAMAAFAAIAAAGGCGDDDAASPSDDGSGTVEPDAAGGASDAAPEPDAAPIADAAPDAAVAPTVMALGMGNNIACAVLTTGAVRCWGANDKGQVGMGEATPAESPITSPTDVVGLTDALTVDCGTAHCCARTASGGAQCWGLNDAGSLGANIPQGQLDFRATPGPVLEQASGATLDNVAQVAVGGAHVCALQAGQVLCWGWNAAGQGGLPLPPDTNPAARPTGITDVAALSLARVFVAQHTCAITTAGAVQCWGFNSDGQLGDGTQTGGSVAVAVTGIVSATAIATGQAHTCAIARDAADPDSGPGVFCWGNSFFGQAGPDAVSPQLTPVRVPGLDGATGIAAGQSHTCAVLDGGTARCFGANDAGQLGSGAASPPSATPLDVVDPNGEGKLTGIAELTGGFGNTCARTSAGEVFCWGANFAGQLGQGSAGDPSPRPVAVPVVPAAP